MKNVAIKENHLYSKAYAKGKRFSGRRIAVFVLKDYAAKRLMLANPRKEYVNRVGLSVTKKYGKATERVRAKRILREAYRAIEIDADAGLKKGFLIVIAVRDGCRNAKTPDIEREMRFAFKKLGMIRDVEREKSTVSDADSKNVLL